MRDEFLANFSAFKGEPWVLSSGAVFDDLMATYVGTLTVESPLHSFVLDDIAMVFELVNDDGDKTELRSALGTRDGKIMEALPNVEISYLQSFDKMPCEVLEQLQSGWRLKSSTSNLPDASFFDLVQITLYNIYFTYQKDHFCLPRAMSESWYMHMHGIWGFLMTFFNLNEGLVYMPGEVYSQASALRKNKARSLDSKYLQGRKLDGIVACSKSHLELCAVEASKVDNGQTCTKALSDKRKLTKAMKDMFDAICRMATVDVSCNLAVFGMRIAAESASLYTLRRHRGRFYQLSCEAEISFPPEWDAEGDRTSNILAVISQLLRFKQQILSPLLRTSRNGQKYRSPLLPLLMMIPLQPRSLLQPTLRGCRPRSF